MIIDPTTPNTVQVSTVPSEFKQKQDYFSILSNLLVSGGCCQTEFDPTYPIRLNGIITQAEFQQSIDNINRSISGRWYYVVVGILAGLCIIGACVLYIAGGVTTAKSSARGFSLLIAIATGVFILGMIVMLVGCCIIRARFADRLRKAITAESAKYSTRSPTPCSWRLHTTQYTVNSYRNRRLLTVYTVSDTILR